MERLGFKTTTSLKHQILTNEVSDDSSLERGRPEAIPDSRPSQFRRDSSSEEEFKARPITRL